MAQYSIGGKQNKITIISAGDAIKVKDNELTFKGDFHIRYDGKQKAIFWTGRSSFFSWMTDTMITHWLGSGGHFKTEISFKNSLESVKITSKDHRTFYVDTPYF